jgi:hypothetical protein
MLTYLARGVYVLTITTIQGLNLCLNISLKIICNYGTRDLSYEAKCKITGHRILDTEGPQKSKLLSHRLQYKLVASVLTLHISQRFGVA